MSLECRISFKDGSINVANADGTPSELFNEALEFTNFNEKKALDLWKVAYTEDFTIEARDHKDDATLTEVLVYLDTHASVGKRLTVGQKNEIVSIMEHSGFDSLSDLSMTLNKIFKSTGILGLNSDAAIASGLYTQEDLEQLDLEKIRNILNNIEGELSKADFQVSPTLYPIKYRDTTRRTILGGSRNITEEQIYEEIKNSISNFNDPIQVNEAINNLPYTDFVEKYNNNSSFAKKVNTNLSRYTRVPIKRYVNDELVDSNSPTATTINNTILSDIDIVPIEADISILENISPEIWASRQDLIRSVLFRMESEQIKNNIDIIGLYESAENQEIVLNVLYSMRQMAIDPSPENISIFSEQIDNIRPEIIDGVVLELPEIYKGLSVYRIDSNETPGALFEQYGLIKIDDNLYHEVAKDNLSEAYEFLYDKVMEGTLVLPTVPNFTNIENKIQVLKDIASFVNSRETGIETTENELLSANQLVWEHLPLKDNVSSEHLADIKTNENYLKTSFISDMYSYILEEKQKDSDLYRDVLSKIQITDSDITFLSPIKSIENLKYTEELKDYIRLKKDGSMKYVLPPANPLKKSETIEYLNTPQKVKTYSEKFAKYGEYYVTKSNNQEFIKINGVVYRQTISNDKASVYKKQPIKESLYATTDVTNYFNMEEAQQVLAAASWEFTDETIKPEMKEIPQYDITKEDPLKEVNSCN
jgi:hypothetical protein